MGKIAWFSPGEIGPYFVFDVACTIALLVLLFVYLAYRYRRYSRYRDFEQEMRTLNLEPNEENTLSEMVKRYAVGEPVQVLYSRRLFDELAAKEMQRVLRSPAPATAKEQLIDVLYGIRSKTYRSMCVSDGPFDSPEAA